MFTDNSYMSGLGDYIPITTPTFTPATASIQAAIPVASSPSFWTNVMNIGNKVIGTVNTVLPAAQNLKTTIDALKAKSSGSTGTTQSGSGPVTYGSAAPASTGLGAGAVVALVLGATAVLGGGGYLIYKAQKKK